MNGNMRGLIADLQRQASKDALTYPGQAYLNYPIFGILRDVHELLETRAVAPAHGNFLAA